MRFTNEDIKLVERFIEIKNKGLYADGTQLTTVYNRVLDKNLAPTNCGSCIRARINELETELNKFKRQLELASNETKKEEADSTPQEENKAVRKARNKK